jgi:hypothetical protein
LGNLIDHTTNSVIVLHNTAVPSLGLVENRTYGVLGLGRAEGVGVTRHLTPCWTTAAGHMNQLVSAAADKTHHDRLFVGEILKAAL